MGRRAVLMVLKDGVWRYVFGRNRSTGGIALTDNRVKAQPGRGSGTIAQTKGYFERHFANHKFRIEI